MYNLFESIIDNEAILKVQEVLKSTNINQGKLTDEFEAKLSQQLNLRYPLAINSCTNALFLSLKLCDIQNGDEVIVSPNTFISSCTVPLMCGAKSIFADIDKNGLLSLDGIKNKVTEKTKAIILVHFTGLPCDLEPIYKFAQENNIKVIEDAAQSLGSHYKSSTIGDCKYSDFCCFSLQCIKSLTTGDGGILCCKNEEDYIRAEKLRWFGASKKFMKRDSNGDRIFDISELGYKMNFTDINAAIGLGNLTGFRERLQQRIILGKLYEYRLSNIDGLRLPQLNYDYQSNYWLFMIAVENRKDLIKKLRSNNIECGIIDKRIDSHTIFGGPFDLPNQNWYEDRKLAIPLISQMTLDDILYIIETIKEGW